MFIAKEELTRLIQEQPDDSSREEIVRELAFHIMVQRGFADSDAKRVISNDEMTRRIRSGNEWHSPGIILSIVIEELAGLVRPEFFD